jgi:hypothetical protein
MIQSFGVMRVWLIEKTNKDGFRNVAKEIGVDAKTVYNICTARCKNPSLSTLMKIDEAMTKSNYSEAPDDSHILDLREKPAILIFPDEQEGCTGLSLKTNIGDESELYKYVAATFIAVSMKQGKTEADVNDFVSKIYENRSRVCGIQ